MGESPILWAWVAPHCRKRLITLHFCLFDCESACDRGDEEELWENLFLTTEMLGLDKFQAVQEIRLSAVSGELLEAILKHKGLKRVIIATDFKGFSTSDETRMFSEVLHKMEELQIRRGPGNMVLPIIMQNIASLGESRLKRIGMNNLSLSGVNKEELADLVCKMEEVDLSNQYLGEQTVKAIFLSISNGSRLKRLNFSHYNPEYSRMNGLVT